MRIVKVGSWTQRITKPLLMLLRAFFSFSNVADTIEYGWLDTYTLYIRIYIYIIEGSLEVKLPTIWTVEKQRWEESEEKRSEESREKSRKVGKSRNTVFFQWFVAPEGRKVGSLKRRVRSQLARWEMRSCTPLWREAHFQVKMYKAHQVRTTFGSCDVEKVHAVVARSTFPSQKC